MANKCNHLWGIKIKYEHGNIEYSNWAKWGDGRLVNHYSLEYIQETKKEFEREFNMSTYKLWVECFECGEIHD